MARVAPKLVRFPEATEWVIDALNGASVPPDVFLGIVNWLDGDFIESAVEHQKQVQIREEEREKVRREMARRLRQNG